MPVFLPEKKKSLVAGWGIFFDACLDPESAGCLGIAVSDG
jgi:hypothetical protein